MLFRSRALLPPGTAPAPAPMGGVSTLASLSTPVKSRLVNWLPWSVLKISGLPCRAIASRRASMQNPVSMVFDNRHARTWRVAQSMIATRYKTRAAPGCR